jgi:hypothetical protein
LNPYVKPHHASSCVTEQPDSGHLQARPVALVHSVPAACHSPVTARQPLPGDVIRQSLGVMAAGSGRQRKEEAKAAAFAAAAAFERLASALHDEAGHGPVEWAKCSRCLDLMGVASIGVRHH